MRDYILMTDSCCDLSQQMVEDLGLVVLPLSVLQEGKEYRDYPDHRELDPKVFYQKLRAGAMGSTSAANVESFREAMEPILQAGKDILSINFSSALSTTCQSAAMAARELGEQYPEGKMIVIDSLCASLGQGMLVYLAAQEKAKGKTIDQVADFVRETIPHLCHWFTVDDLNHLKRGERVSAAAALFGTMLQMKPVLHVDDEGHLINVAKARGRKASLLALADKVGELAEDPAEQLMYISHSDCEEDARFVADEVKKRYGVREIRINNIGPVIGAHTGPGCVALFFFGKHR